MGLVFASMIPATAQAQTGEMRLVAKLDEKRVTESSGVAVSRRNPGIIWTHNDSGDGPYVYATDRKGRAIAVVTVAGVKAVDWEDMAVGPGPDGEPALYMGDIGDNNANRANAAIIRVPEPKIDASRTGQNVTTMLAHRFPFVYPDGPHDAETLLVHPKTGEVTIVTKLDSGVSGVYRYPGVLQRDRMVTLEKVGEVRFANPLRISGRNVGKLATGGAWSPDGKRVAIRTYTDGFEWTVRPGEQLKEALKRKPRKLDVPWLGQYESICYDSAGKTFYFTCEGHPCLLWEAPCAPQSAVPTKRK